MTGNIVSKIAATPLTSLAMASLVRALPYLSEPAAGKHRQPLNKIGFFRKYRGWPGARRKQATSNLGLIRVHLCSSVALCLSPLRPHNPQAVYAPIFISWGDRAPAVTGFRFAKHTPAEKPSPTLMYHELTQNLRPLGSSKISRMATRLPKEASHVKSWTYPCSSVFICGPLPFPSASPQPASCIRPNFHFLG